MRIKSHCCHAEVGIEDVEGLMGYRVCSHCANSKTYHECLAEELPDCEACQGDTVWYKGETYEVENLIRYTQGWCANLSKPGCNGIVQAYTRDVVRVKMGEEAQTVSADCIQT